MRYLSVVVFTLVCVCALNAQENVRRAPQQVQIENKIGDLWYDRDAQAKTAVLIPNRDLNKMTGLPIPYKLDTIKVPYYITKEVADFGGGTVIDTFAVVRIADSAFVKSTAKVVAFANPSQVTEIGSYAFCSMNKMTSKLVLPASLTDLSVSAILLPKITEIEFLGTVPPTCQVETYNPWTSASISTPDSIKITVPAGALSAYQDAPGIGDYFTCLKKGPATAIEENAEAMAPQQKKVLRNGRLYILRDGVVYDAQGQKQ